MNHLSSINRRQGMKTGWAPEICKDFLLNLFKKLLPRDVGKMERETVRDTKRNRERERRPQWKLHCRYMADIESILIYTRPRTYAWCRCRRQTQHMSLPLQCQSMSSANLVLSHHINPYSYVFLYTELEET